MTAKEAIQHSLEILQPAPIQCADRPLHARQIVCAALDWELSKLLLKSDQVLTPEQVNRIRSWSERRASGEPFQYIVGYEWFWESKFVVGPGVLIPRPETEHTVEAVIELAPPGAVIAELGAGSGCIGLSVLLERPDLKWIGFEKSAEALPFLEKNVAQLQAQSDYQIVPEDFFSGIGSRSPVDLIVSNPPYVPTLEIATLSREVQHEPRIALDGGGHGLEVLQRLITESPKYLRSGGYLILEIGSEQEQEVLGSFAGKGYSPGLCRRDLAGLPRVVIAQRS